MVVDDQICQIASNAKSLERAVAELVMRRTATAVQTTSRRCCCSVSRRNPTRAAMARFHCTSRYPMSAASRLRAVDSANDHAAAVTAELANASSSQRARARAIPRTRGGRVFETLMSRRSPEFQAPAGNL